MLCYPRDLLAHDAGIDQLKLRGRARGGVNRSVPPFNIQTSRQAANPDIKALVNHSPIPTGSKSNDEPPPALGLLPDMSLPQRRGMGLYARAPHSTSQQIAARRSPVKKDSK